MAVYTLEARGPKEAAAELEGMGQRATQMRAVYGDLIDALLQGERTLWDRNSWTLRDWPPNTKATFARKIARGQDPRVMRATGTTYRALTVKGAPDQIARGGANVLDFGVQGVGANVAQFSKNPKRRREVVKLLPATRKTIGQIILSHIVEGTA